MKTIKFIFFILAVISFSSCENVVQVKLDEGEPIITIDAFINDMRSQQKVRLTFTDGFFSQSPNKAVTGASVQLKDITTGINYTFTDNSDGNYVYNLTPADTIGRIGHTYELMVSYQGDVFTSTSRLNRTTKVDSIGRSFNGPPNINGNDDEFSLAFLGFDVPGDTTDYYWIKSFKNGVFNGRGGDINVCIDGAFGAGADGFVFITPISEGITPFDNKFKKFDLCRVEIHSINLETYNFLLQVQQQTTNSGLFATNPENVRTNIRNESNSKTKVVGWFCMSAVGFKEAVAQ